MESLFWIALSLVEKMGDRNIKKLYDSNPNLKYVDIFNNSHLKEVINNKTLYERILDKGYFAQKLDEAKQLITLHAEKNIDVIPIDSPYYPELLRYIEDPPALLYCKGNIELLTEMDCIAVIGTRSPTEYGKVAAKKIARIFADRGFTIVSGLALGVDTAGHQGALEAKNGKTIAILANSLEKIYPAKNKLLAEQILDNEGLLISEIPLGKKTFRGSFVSRDRIQSGMSLGVCPVQAPLKSGTHHTIAFAQKQNRLVFCPIPVEPIEVEAVQGIYKLIETQQVEVISNKDSYDVIQNLLMSKKDELISLSKSTKNHLVTNERSQNLFDFMNKM